MNDSYPHHVDNSESHFSALEFATQPRRLIWEVLGVAGIGLILGGLYFSYSLSHKVSPAPVVAETHETKVSVKNIKLDVEGAVESPGIIEVPYDSRIQDVLIAAGGLAAKADRNTISKTVNMAQKVTDGMKVYFPFVGEPSMVKGTSALSINLSTVDELDNLPGIGVATAEKIIEGRPYQNISELVSKRAVSKTVFDKIKDKIAL